MKPDTLPAAFAAWAAHAPDDELIATHIRTVTVGEVAMLAGGLLERLRGIDEGGRPVLVAARDAIELAVALLAATGAGSPIVPVDPRRSPAAIVRLATDIGAQVLVVGAGSGAGVHAGTGLTVLAPLASTSDGYRPVAVRSDDAYALLATSGSTGEPRFVEGTHRALLNGLRSESAGPSFLPDDRVARTFNHAGLTVNMLGTNVLRRIPTLLLDPLVVPPSRFLPMLAAHRITYAHYTPSLLRNAMRAAPAGALLETMRTIGGGGEPMTWTDVAMIRRVVGPGCVVFHSYGATECGPIARNIVPADRALGEGVVPVGRPVDGRVVRIEAGDGTPAGPGVIGEIVVEGDLGRRSPRITSTAEGRDRYRTGDLGSFDADGDLHHHGRIDRMLKIGGVRIEPAAVEAVIRDLPGVHDVAIIPIELGDGHGRRLIAHVVVDPTHPPDVAQLRSAAAERLASAAVPARFQLRTDPLPLLPSGKVDHQTLTAAG